MPLLRIIFENVQLWVTLAHTAIRIALIPTTLTFMLYGWAVSDAQRGLNTSLAVIKEIIHIFPCVFGQLGLIYYEPIEDLKAVRNKALSEESSFANRLYKRVTMKYSTGLKILVDHGSNLIGSVISYFNVWVERYKQVLNFWNLTKTTEDHLLHYPRCFLKHVYRNVLALNPFGSDDNNNEAVKDKTVKFKDNPTKMRPYNLPTVRQTKREKSVRKSEKRMLGINTLPPTTIDIADLNEDLEFTFDKMFNDSLEKLDSRNKQDGAQSKFKKSKELESSKSLPINSSFEPCSAPLVLDSKQSHNQMWHRKDRLLTPLSSNNIDNQAQGPLERSFVRKLKRSPVKRRRELKNLGTNVTFSSKEGDYDAVKKSVVSVIDNKEFDDGSLGPVVVRLAWHCCATYDKETGTGGSNGATIRFIPELNDPGNTGLEPARLVLEIVKQQFPWITYADLYTLAGATAIEAMGGPKIEWKPGRTDCIDSRFVPQNGRLPIGSRKADHIKEIFYRMGFSDQEIVCLMGTHTLGRTHKKYSGWDGKWTDNPIKFDNEFYKLLLADKWELGTVPETGSVQYFNIRDRQIMMLQTDMEMIYNEEFLKWVKLYAEDQGKYFEDFAKAFAKLLELGVDRNDEGIAIKTK